jgi:hypothetical protein
MRRRTARRPQAPERAAGEQARGGHPGAEARQRVAGLSEAASIPAGGLSKIGPCAVRCGAPSEAHVASEPVADRVPRARLRPTDLNPGVEHSGRGASWTRCEQRAASSRRLRSMGSTRSRGWAAEHEAAAWGETRPRNRRLAHGERVGSTVVGAMIVGPRGLTIISGASCSRLRSRRRASTPTTAAAALTKGAVRSSFAGQNTNCPTR